jgi:hypothetical protein
MRLGIIARADKTGLGYQTKELVESAIKAVPNKEGFDAEMPEYLQEYMEDSDDPYPDFDISNNEVEKENNAVSNPTIQPNTPPVVSAEEYFTNPEADADTLLNAQEARKQDKVIKAYKEIESELKDKISKVKTGDKAAMDWLKEKQPIIKAYNALKKVNI